MTGPDQWLLPVIIDFSQHSSPEHCHLQPKRQADSSRYIFHSQIEKKNIFLVNINFSDLGSCRAKKPQKTTVPRGLVFVPIMEHAAVKILPIKQRSSECRNSQPCWILEFPFILQKGRNFNYIHFHLSMWPSEIQTRNHLHSQQVLQHSSCTITWYSGNQIFTPITIINNY